MRGGCKEDKPDENFWVLVWFFCVEEGREIKGGFFVLPVKIRIGKKFKIFTLLLTYNII